jgi:hypothetical protein
MRAAFGLKAHSGWAALVVIGNDGDGLHVIDRRRIELVESREGEWPGQPYHAAEGLPPADARKIVNCGIDIARRCAVAHMRSAIKRTRDAGHEIAACAVLTPAPMPQWSTEEILAVHFRMHKAEGVMYPEALARAAKTCGLNLVAIAEKSLGENAEKALATTFSAAKKKIAALGKSVGPPWGADQKNATLAAMTALKMIVQAQ